MTRCRSALLLTIPASLALFSPALAEDPRPRIVVVEETLDLGSVPRGEVARGSFEIENEGDATLAILRAKPS